MSLTAVKDESREHSRQRTRLFCFVLCFAGFLFSWSIWAPGFMSPDSYHQWSQVKSGHYVDDHPTIMVLLWRAIHIFQHGPTGLLFLHLCVFWLSLLSLSLRLLPRLGASSLAVLFVGLAPPVFGSLGAIWKDIGLGVSLLAALAIVGHLLQRFSWKHFSLAVLFLIYAQNVRHNAPSAAIPFWIVLALIGLRHLKKNTSLRSVGLLALGMLIIGSLSYKTIEALFLKPERSYFVQNLLLHDLAALSTSKHQLLIPESYRDPGCTLEGLSETYSGDSRCYDSLFYGKYPLRRIPSKEATSSLARLWIREVSGNPMAYLRHRWTFFVGTLGWKGGPCRAHQILHLYDWRDPRTRSVGMVGRLQRIFSWFEKFPIIFTPWVYLALSTVLFVLGLRSETGIARNLLLVSSSSGILYFLPYFFVTVCCDFRYSWWLALSSLLAVVFYSSTVAKTKVPSP